MQGAGGLGCSLERHVCPFDALLLCDLLHRDVQGSAGARCSIVDLAGVGTRVVDQLPECFPRRVTTDYDAKRVAADADDVSEIGRRIEAGLAHEGKTKDRYRYLHQRRSEEHTSELQSLRHLVCRLLLEKKNPNKHSIFQSSRKMFHPESNRRHCKFPCQSSVRLDLMTKRAPFDYGLQASVRPTRSLSEI